MLAWVGTRERKVRGGDRNGLKLLRGIGKIFREPRSNYELAG